jgi:hypothetical protein
MSGCNCRCGGSYSLNGRSTPTGFQGKFRITKLTKGQPGNVSFTRINGSSDIKITPDTGAIDANGNITNPNTGFFLVHGATTNDNIPAGCAVFKVAFQCRGSNCDCFGYIKIKINDPDAGEVSLEFLNDEPVACQ